MNRDPLRADWTCWRGWTLACRRDSGEFVVNAALPNASSPTLGQIMTRQVTTVDMDDSLDTVRRAFESSRFHHLLVTDHSRLIGVVSDRDLLKNISPFIGKLAQRDKDLHTLNRRVHQIMSRKLITADEDMTVRDGAWLMLEHSVSCLPIVTEDRYVRGIVTWRDLLRACWTCGPTQCQLPDAA